MSITADGCVADHSCHWCWQLRAELRSPTNIRQPIHRTTAQAFREDRTLICAMDYIAEALGPRFVESVPLNMERAWAESHPRCPLICLLSPGSACT